MFNLQLAGSTAVKRADSTRGKLFSILALRHKLNKHFIFSIFEQYDIPVIVVRVTLCLAKLSLLSLLSGQTHYLRLLAIVSVASMAFQGYQWLVTL